MKYYSERFHSILPSTCKQSGYSVRNCYRSLEPEESVKNWGANLLRRDSGALRAQPVPLYADTQELSMMSDIVHRWIEPLAT